MTVRELERLQPRRHALPAMETAVVLTRARDHPGGRRAHRPVRHPGWSGSVIDPRRWGFARFDRAEVGAGTSLRMLRTATRIRVPAMLWLALRAVHRRWRRRQCVADQQLCAGQSGVGYWSARVLIVQRLLALAVVLAVPAVQRLERHGYTFGPNALACDDRVYRPRPRHAHSRVPSSKRRRCARARALRSARSAK